MVKNSYNDNLHSAKKSKNDEFYTQISDIEKELQYYEDYFIDKSVYCNCDNPDFSNFYRYFIDNFNRLKLKKLYCSYYSESGAYLYEHDDYGLVVTELQGDGDFRSPEAIEILKEADIVVTNPPFSLFREYVTQLIEYDKKFLIIGNDNAISYKEVFPLLMKNRVWIGVNKAKSFLQPDGTIKKFGNIGWYTNIDHKKRNEELILYQNYYGNEDNYPKYDNYDAIEVSKTKDIPIDFNGEMGVPITFLDKYNPKQFVITGNAGSYAPDGYSLCSQLFINKQKKFKRIMIRRKLPNEN